MKKLFLLLAGLIVSTLSLSAQDFSDPRYAKFGDTPEQRKENIKTVNYFSDAYKTKAYNDALKYMHQVIENCPKASLNVYIQGGDIYRIKMARATTKQERMLYLDSMLYLLDLRIEHFGDHAKYGKHYLHAQKALIFNENNPMDRERAFELFREALNTSRHEVDPEMCVVFFNSLTESFKLDDISPEEYIEDFEFIASILEQGSKTEEDEQALSIISNIFAGSGAASCENIETIFRPQYEADPNNADLVRKILGMFQRSKCSSDFQLALTEKYYNIDPTPELAAMLGSIYENKGEYAKAVQYFNTAIDGTTNTEDKIKMLTLATSAALSGKQYSSAANFSRQLISLSPDSGYGYLFLASAYEGGAAGCSGFEQQAAYWLVVDAYARARSKFEGDQTQTDKINRLISRYSSNFPTVEETFMRGLSPGDSYTVRCGWLSGTTSVRERK